MHYPNTVKEVESLGDYRVWIWHLRDTEGERNGHQIKCVTQVQICRPFTRSDENRTVLSTGQAFCSTNDDFNKKIGVMIALGRASKALGLHRA